MRGRQLYTTADVIAVERTILGAAAAANDAQDRVRVPVATPAGPRRRARGAARLPGQPHPP